MMNSKVLWGAGNGLGAKALSVCLGAALAASVAVSQGCGPAGSKASRGAGPVRSAQTGTPEAEELALGLKIGVAAAADAETGAMGGTRPSTERAIRFTLVDDGNSLNLLEPLEFKPGSTGEVQPLFITLGGTIASQPITNADFSHKVMKVDSSVQGPFPTRVFSHDAPSGRWFLEVGDLLEEAQVAVDAEDLHILEARFVLANGATRSLNLMFRLRMQAPALEIVSGSGPVGGIPGAGSTLVYREIVRNAGNFKVRVLSRVTGTGAVDSWLKTQKFKAKDGYLQDVKDTVEHASGALRYLIGAENGVHVPGWLSIELAPGETATLEWIAEPAGAVCAVSGPRKRKFRMLMVGNVKFDQTWRWKGARMVGSVVRELRVAQSQLSAAQILSATPETSGVSIERAVQELGASQGSGGARTRDYSCQGVVVR
ncbi:MAG: hypothetical protein IT285_03890 [Bdellovibrionales bacterium]|nr:hypothetical protein [Bdellovibrionales bacterium]